MPAALTSTERSVRRPDDTDGWVLTIPLNDPWAATLRRGAFAEGHELRAFFEGLLSDRDELAAIAGVDSSAPDAEILLAAYERHGEDVFPRLRGAFVAVVVDRARRAAFVVRDPFGSHPLFYAQHHGRLTFASAAARVAAESGASSAISREGLVDHLCHRWSFRDETLFVAVKRVPQGWLATIRDGRVACRRYWNPVPLDGPIEWHTEAEAERFDEQLDRAVDRCLRAGPTAIFLSGGLDSISIAAVAADRARRASYDVPHALSLAFPEPCNEEQAQIRVAETLGLKQSIMPFEEAVGPKGLLRRALEMSSTLSSPILNTWMPAYFSLAAAGAPPAVRAVMTGSGGDEWLGASPYLMADLLRAGDLAGLARFLSVWQLSFRQSWPKVIYSGLWQFGLRPVASMWLHRIAPKAWDRNRLARIPEHDPPYVAPGPDLKASLLERAKGALVAADPVGGFYARESKVFLDCAFGSWEAEERYEFGRQMGVRYMHPYWDPDLVAQIYRTHPTKLNFGGRAKGLVRGTLARRFPNLGFERQKKVSAVDFYRSLLRTEGPGLAASVGPLRALRQLEVVEPVAAEAAVKAAFSGRPDVTNRAMHEAWDLLNLEMWTRARMSL